MESFPHQTLHSTAKKLIKSLQISFSVFYQLKRCEHSRKAENNHEWKMQDDRSFIRTICFIEVIVDQLEIRLFERVDGNLCMQYFFWSHILVNNSFAFYPKS